ncbi:glycosyltransferase family 4 protein [Maribacter sp. Asnod1-A12]|uniref:glycosyltransferase family 4 protein n=1 Tax=Maribacter sp. Asnod1-A12 TaxID=3160576 RepID=UPI00386C250A
MEKKPKVLVIATSRKTRGGITSVVKSHEKGNQWKNYHCKWIETHRDGSFIIKIWYLCKSLITYTILLPFYQLTHIHVGLKASVKRKMIFATLAKWANKPIIIHFHPATEKHLFDKKHSESIYKLFMLADKLIVLSEQWIRWINKAYPDNNFNFQVLYNPCPQVIRSVKKVKPYILFAGTLNERKGYNRLLSAFAQIGPRNPEWRIKFAGNGEIEKAKKIAEDLNIESQVDFLGWVSGSEKDKVFSQASIYCLPSWGEGFPMGVLDAIAYGIPVITTPVGGIPDLIKNGENGYIFDTYNTEMLVEQLFVLMESQESRMAIVREADKLMKNEFNLQIINHQLSLIYEGVINGKLKR